MEILWLIIQDFKTFRGRHKIDFRQYGPGLYFMRGENQDEEDLGSNGAGKSTVWDALHWCWYGTSVRGTPSTQLVPWSGGGKPAVEFAARIGGKPIRIIRTHRPNTLSIRSGGRTKGVTQDEVNDLLGLTSETVQSSIIIGQYSRYFFDLKPREKMNVLTDLMDLDYWTQCGKKASGAVAVLKEDAHTVEKELAALRAVKKQLQSDLEKLQLEESASPSEEALLGLRDSLREQRIYRKKLLRRRTSQRRQLAEVEERAVELNKTKSDWAEKIDRHNDAAKEIQRNLQDVQKATETFRGEIRKLRQKKFGGEPYRCPTCKQPVDDAHRRKEIRRIEDLINKGRDAIKDLGELYAKEKAEEDKAANEYNKFKTALGAIDTRILERKIYHTNSELKSVRKDIENVQEKISAIKEYDKKQQSNIAEVEGDIKEKTKAINQAKRELGDLEFSIGQASYWAKTFKDIRLFEINDILTSLEVEVNSYLADLGMGSWSVKMEVERETRRGSVSRGFRVMVDPGTSSSSGAAKPWEAWSGGEGQRLRSAGTLALANLILRQYNRTSNIQVWDEKLYWLSGSGESDMLELLQEIAVQEGKQIWLIDQHNLDFPFDGYIKVVKDRDGSHVIQ